MPIYEYGCSQCSEKTTRYRKYEVRREPVNCSSCGAPSKLVPSLISKTATKWGDTPWDGKVDRGLGVTLRSSEHRDAVMRERGVREIEPGEVEAEQSRVQREHEEHEANMKTYDRVLADTGCALTAMEQTFPNPEV